MKLRYQYAKKKSRLCAEVDALEKKVTYFEQIEQETQPCGLTSVNQFFDLKRKIGVIKKHILHSQSEILILRNEIEKVQNEINEFVTLKNEFLHKECKISKRIVHIKRAQHTRQLMFDDILLEDIRHGVRKC